MFSAVVSVARGERQRCSKIQSLNDSYFQACFECKSCAQNHMELLEDLRSAYHLWNGSACWLSAAKPVLYAYFGSRPFPLSS